MTEPFPSSRETVVIKAQSKGGGTGAWSSDLLVCPECRNLSGPAGGFTEIPSSQPWLQVIAGLSFPLQTPSKTTLQIEGWEIGFLQTRGWLCRGSR